MKHLEVSQKYSAANSLLSVSSGDESKHGVICCVIHEIGIKTISRGFSGGKQVIKSANTSNRGRVCLFWTKENEELIILTRDAKRQVIGESVHCNFIWKL